jgi:hypothetical protein
MAKTNYCVQIQGADNGILVEVGCKRLVFKTDEIDAKTQRIYAHLKNQYYGGGVSVYGRY